MEARKALGISRDKLSNLAKLAGIQVSPTSIKKLETEGEKAIGSRGLSDQVVGYLSYILGLGTFEAADWSSVEQGAPVIVTGEKGVFSFVSANDESVTVFGNTLRTFSVNDARPAASSGVPSASSAHLFEKRTRGDGGLYAKQVLGYISARPGDPQAVGSIAYALGLDNGVVSRTVAGLIKAGKLSKAGRGVVILANTSEAPAAAEAPAAPAAEVPVQEELPQF